MRLPIIFTIFFISCGFPPERQPPNDPPLPQNPKEGDNNDDESFDKDVKPILQDNCALSGCHAGSQMLEDKTAFLNSNSPRRIINGSMPPSYSPKIGQWTDEKKSTVLEWYDDNM